MDEMLISCMAFVLSLRGVPTTTTANGDDERRTRQAARAYDAAVRARRPPGGKNTRVNFPLPGSGEAQAVKYRQGEGSSRNARAVRAARDAVFLSGIATMLIELVWTRVLALTMGGSAHAFAIMLAGARMLRARPTMPRP